MNLWREKYQGMPQSHKIALACIGLGKEMTKQLLEACESEEAELIGYWCDRLQGADPVLIEMALAEFASRLQVINGDDNGSGYLEKSDMETALKLYCLPLDQASTLMETLTLEKQIETVRCFEDFFDKNYEENPLEAITEIMSAMPLAKQSRLYEELHRRHPNLCSRLKNQSFLIENINGLEKSELQRLVAAAEPIDLYLSLVEANPVVREQILGMVDSEERERIAKKVIESNTITTRQVELAQLRLGRIIHEKRRNLTAKSY